MSHFGQTEGRGAHRKWGRDRWKEGEAWLSLCNPLWQPPQHLLRLSPSPILRDNREPG